MTRENKPNNGDRIRHDAPMSAWEEAARLGIDMSLLEDSLRKTPEERIREHSYALATVELLLAHRRN